MTNNNNNKAINAEAARWAAVAKAAQKNPQPTGFTTTPLPPQTGYSGGAPEFDAGLAERSEYQNSNPNFIYPTPVERIASLKANEKDLGSNSLNTEIKRGYIRRLTEYYGKVKGISQTNSLANFRCNFQFNPQTISRSVNANYDMQFFFNQSPDQLAQPIPGQSTFSIELLFNREAEVATSMYRGEDGTLTQGNPYEKSWIASSPGNYITNPYDPKWVTEIGVLADLKILDDIIGQGIAQDLIKNAAAFKTTSTTTSSSNKDATDTASSDPAAGFTSGKLGPYSANMGNKAFLVPTPIRLLISELFMIEGFVMSSQVVFNKFSTKMVPTQALVGLQIQALYFGFAQKNTFLSTLDVTPDTGTGANVIPAPTQSAADKALVTQIEQGLVNFFKSVKWDEGRKQGKRSIIDSVFNNANNDQIFNFTAVVSPAGCDLYRKISAGGKLAGGMEFSFTGTIKIWWHSYVYGASNSRSTIATDAAGSWTYKSGTPPKTDTNGISLATWGTNNAPLTLTCKDMDATYNKRYNGTIDRPVDEVKFGDQGSPFSHDKEAHYKWERPVLNLPLPFNQDKFNIDLEIVIKVTRGGQTVTAPQKIVKSYRGLEAGSDKLWEIVTLSPAYLERIKVR